MAKSTSKAAQARLVPAEVKAGSRPRGGYEPLGTKLSGRPRGGYDVLGKLSTIRKRHRSAR
jgi:hypothetical protein